MKKLIILLVSVASLTVISTSGNSKYAFKNISTISYDTLPLKDTMGEANWQHNQMHKDTTNKTYKDTGNMQHPRIDSGMIKKDSLKTFK